MRARKMFAASVIAATSLVFSSQFTEAATSDFYQLWKDESISSSSNPSDLDIYSNGVYTNKQFGYTISIPESWELDRHQIPNYTRFFGTDFRLDVYFDDLDSKYKTVDEYITETTEAIQSLITNESTYSTSSGLEIRSFDYKRSPLEGIQNDLTSYSYFFVISGKDIYTFQLKTSDNNFAAKKQEVINLLTAPSTSFSKGEEKDVNESFVPSTTSPDIEIAAEKRTLKIKPNKIAFGIYQPGDASGVLDVEEDLDTHFGTQMFYKHINTPYDNYVDDMVAKGRVPLVTIHFDNVDKTTTNSTNLLNTINGAYDDKILSWANGIKNTKSPVFFRIGNEMNGKWTPWSHKNMYNDPDLYKMAYRHIADVFKSNNVTNVRFVWNPNDHSDPNYAWNDAAMYYPGDNYVDWLGMTAYNFAETGKEFKYFDDLYEDLYKTYLRSFANKPMLIGEFASSEKAGNKPLFIGEMFDVIKEKYPNLKLVIWFNGEPENDLPINSSVESETAFKEVVKHSTIVQHPLVENASDWLALVTETNSETNQSKFEFTGVALDSNVNSVSLNGIPKTFIWESWKQFDEVFSLKKGRNTINIVANMKDGTQKQYNYHIYKKSSFKFATAVSESAVNAPITEKSQIVLTGLVTDNSVASLKINGVSTDIKWSWRQFDSEPISLKNGLNEFVLEGYNSEGNLLTTEIFYVFNDGDVRVTSPTTTESTIFTHTRTITGLAPKANIKWVKVDGFNQTLNWSWRQFDQTLEFDYGDNSFYVDSLYEHVNSKGETVYFPIHKQYKIHAPSFKFLNAVDYIPEKAGQHHTDLSLIEGLVKDKRINSLKINGEPVTFLYDWKQFRHPVELTNGYNMFVLTGYSDENFQNKVVEETVYLFNGNDLIVTSPKETFVQTTRDEFAITGYAPNSKVSSIKVNGVDQELKWSWRQFDETISLPKAGNNEVKLEAVYEDVVNGAYSVIPFSKTYIIHKPSFQFDKSVSYTIADAPQTSNDKEVVSGTIIDNEVNSLKINDKEVQVGSNRDFSSSVDLLPGINEIRLAGYSDSNYETKIFEEIIFIFNDKGFTVQTPSSPSTIVDEKEVSVSGILEYDNYKSIRINGEDTELLYDWRQFSTKVSLPVGTNSVLLEAVYEGKYKGSPYTYVAKKQYEITVPEGTSNYKFTTPVGSAEENAPETANYTEWVGALVKNGNIKSIKVNGTPVEILYSWRQFSTEVSLKYGLNAIKIEGYSDYNYENKVDEEIVYLKLNTRSFEFLNDVSYNPSEAGQYDTNTAFVEGLVKDTRVKSLKINDDAVTFLYDWKQFKHPVELKNGYNSFTLVGYSDENFQNKVVEETVYLFNGNDVVVTSPKETFIQTTKDEVTITGYTPNSKVSSIKVNGVDQELKWSWRQFDAPINLPKAGNNKVTIEAVYEDVINGTNFTKTFNKTYMIHKPSFSFDKPVSYTIADAQQTSNDTEVVSGTIIDNDVNSLKINDTKVTFGTDKKFSSSVNLVPGINEIKLVGYSDSNYQNKIFEEVIFVFNDKGFTVQTPSSPSVTVNAKETNISGILEYDNYKSLRINGEDTALLYSWRQFSKDIALTSGKNSVVLEATFEGTYKGSKYTYVAKKQYEITVPDGISSYQFTTPVGSTEANAPVTTNGTEWIGALVKNSNIKSVKINGNPVEIAYSWRQISAGIPLNYGVNTIKIEGYSDYNYQNKIEEETVYIYRQ